MFTNALMHYVRLSFSFVSSFRVLNFLVIVNISKANVSIHELLGMLAFCKNAINNIRIIS